VKTTKKNTKLNKIIINDDFFNRLWEEIWTYIKTLVDVVREPILILDKELCVLAANESFYKTFQVEAKETQNKLVYELGNGQWDIPALRKLLEDVLPKNTFLKGFEVAHEFPYIGRKMMILNARRIYRESVATEQSPPIILLAIEDITEMMAVAEKLSAHTNKFETMLTERTEKLELHISRLEIEIGELQKNKAIGKG